MFNSRMVFRCLLIFALLLPGLAGAETLTLGVHPYLPATEIVKRFTPLAEYLKKKTGLPVEVKISKDYRHHIDLIGQNGLDIAYMGPASYVTVVDTYGKKPILARLEIGGFPTFQGVIIVREDCPCSTLADLAGKRFAFGDPDSTMSHLVPRYMLWEAGVGVEKLEGYEFLFSHHNVALGVLVGDFHAGAVKEEVFDEYEPRGLKALAWTPEISEHVFVASSALPKETVATLREALLGLKNDREGKAVMSSIKGTVTALVPARDKDYENLRKILRALKAQGVKP
jgi:phosphonate transport system substrate-binding protein